MMVAHLDQTTHEAAENGTRPGDPLKPALFYRACNGWRGRVHLRATRGTADS